MTVERARRPAAPRVSVIVPTRNEERNLPHVLGRLPRDLHEVVLVDGRSTDGTVAAARAVLPDVRVVTQTRRGKGNAMACGFEAATGDVLVMLDADGSADPGEIPRFVGALTGGADFAKGSRFLPGGGSSDLTRLRQVGNAALSGIANALFRTRFTDLCYGYNALWTDLLPLLMLPPSSAPGAGEQDMLWGDGFEIETLLNLRVARAGLRVVEVPSMERLRLHGESNLRAVPDGVRVLRTIMVERRAGAAPAGALRPSLTPGAVGTLP